MYQFKWSSHLNKSSEREWLTVVSMFNTFILMLERSSVLVNDYNLYYLGFSLRPLNSHRYKGILLDNWSSLLTYQYFNVALLTFDCNWQYYQPSHPHKVQWMYQLKHLHNIKALWLRNSAQPKSLDVVKCILNGHNFPMLIIWWIRAIHIL